MRPIARRSTSCPGAIDETAVYGSALSAARVQAHYTAGTSGGGGNQPPTAVASASPTGGPVPLTVNFSGTASSDSDGTITSYAWDLDGDGQFDDSTAAQPSFQYTVAATYTVRLRVTDNGGASDDSDPLTITATSGGGGGTLQRRRAGRLPARLLAPGRDLGDDGRRLERQQSLGLVRRLALLEPAGSAGGRHEPGRRLQRFQPVRATSPTWRRSTPRS